MIQIQWIGYVNLNLEKKILKGEAVFRLSGRKYIQLINKIDNKRSSPKKNLCLVKKVDTPSEQSVQSTQILQKPQTVISRQDNSYYHQSDEYSKVDNKKQGTEFRRVDQNYQLPLPPTLQARPTQIQPSYSSIQPQPLQQPHSHSHQLLYNNLHTKNNTIQQYKKVIKNGIQQIGGIARRKHSPKTVWRLVRRQQKKHISPKSIISNSNQSIKKSLVKHILDKIIKLLNSLHNLKINLDKKIIDSLKIHNTDQVIILNRLLQGLHNNLLISKKKMTKSRLLILDKKRDVQKRYKQRKTLRSRVKRWNRKKILFYLARRGVVNLNTNAPQKLLKGSLSNL